MKTLILIRHAHALSCGEARVNSDAQRPLSPQGCQTARQTATRLQERNLKPQLLLHSPLLRAAQTAQIIAPVLQVPLQQANELNGFLSDNEVTDFLREQLKHHDTLAAVGHNPNVSCVYQQLTGQFVPFKPGAFAVIQLDDNLSVQSVILGE
ncbi:MAG: histidine phosphatase family protein [Elusimicrobiaceae bacterium]|nr:histidine phosphatase family protein [Elusimicrobiaceae bacterium]